MTTQTQLRELTLTRAFNAPRQLVWDAYTVPEQLAKWWGPKIMHTPVETITIDLRAGGVFRLTMVSNLDGSQYPSEMTIREVTPIEYLAFGWDTQGPGIGNGAITVKFTEVDNQTLVEQHFAGEISDAMFPLMRQGTSEQLDKLGLALDESQTSPSAP